LHVTFEMTGKAAALASQKSEVIIDSVKDENGRQLALKKSDEEGSCSVISRGIGDHEKDDVDFSHDIKRIPTRMARELF